jgi:hypothetical protein
MKKRTPYGVRFFFAINTPGRFLRNGTSRLEDSQLHPLTGAHFTGSRSS